MPSVDETYKNTILHHSIDACLNYSSDLKNNVVKDHNLNMFIEKIDNSIASIDRCEEVCKRKISVTNDKYNSTIFGKIKLLFSLISEPLNEIEEDIKQLKSARAELEGTKALCQRRLMNYQKLEATAKSWIEQSNTLINRVENKIELHKVIYLEKKLSELIPSFDESTLIYRQLVAKQSVLYEMGDIDDLLL